jgi:hypothetical protein
MSRNELLEKLRRQSEFAEKLIGKLPKSKQEILRRSALSTLSKPRERVQNETNTRRST